MKQLQRMIFFTILVLLSACNIVTVPSLTQYEVSFIGYDGTTISSTDIINGNPVTPLSPPTVEGYVFIGWFTDDTYTTSFNFDEPITQDTMIYGWWDKPVALEPYIIGYIGPLSGELGTIGNETLNGIDLAVEELNQAGGILGHTVQVLAYDSGSDGSNAMSNYNTLKGNENLIAIIAGGLYDDIYDVQVAADIDGIAFISTAVTDERNENDTTPAYIIAASNQLRMRLGITQAILNITTDHPGFIYDNLAEDAATTRSAIIQAAQAMGVQMYEIGHLENFTDTEWNHVAISSWDFRGVDYVISVGTGVYMPAIFTKAASMDVDWNYLSVDQWNYQATEILDGHYIDEYSTSDTSSYVQAFTTNYANEYSEQATRYAALGYDSIYILYETMNNMNNITPATVKQNIINVEIAQSITGFKGFDAYGNAIKELVLVYRNDGTEQVEARLQEDE
ncbi:ABC transporter substrate-binding protein [Candidatus Xianfuyuplasma coldseepsis]|uniref:ABC transporter substrate-binding protein n=1 Tax=Candidatus Xianfuyuplasma coldseepsis TaxID=2782163 RepID=A0A7L7KPM4_9MOLU|nr:ABC transporter substrate-binding protein [Xianfuyuplasma coldseepsis]QMS84389.1 ABC transporter substrate-binding protein [Xianfuyuplasma coldseepsis]